MLKHKLVDFIIQFMEEVDKEISEMKLFVRHNQETLYYTSADHHQVECTGTFCCRIFLDTCEYISDFTRKLESWLVQFDWVGGTTRDAAFRQGRQACSSEKHHGIT
jgi:hypothetical protein